MQMKNEIRFDNEPDAAQGFSDLISETSSIAGSTVTKTSQSSRSSGYLCLLNNYSKYSARNASFNLLLLL